MIRRLAVWLMTSAMLLLACGSLYAQASASPRSVVVDLVGARVGEYRFGPVYRRYDPLQIQIRNLVPGVRKQLRLSFARRTPAGWQPVPELVPAGAGGLLLPFAGRIEQTVSLQTPTGPLPIGQYRLEVWQTAGGTAHLLAMHEFAVIFNALQPTDRSAYLPGAAAYLLPDLDIVYMQDEGPSPIGWELDIHDPAVFQLALAAVAGETSAESAVQRLGLAAAELVAGYWPNLAATDGMVPPAAPPSDPSDWQTLPRSVAARLASAATSI